MISCKVSFIVILWAPSCCFPLFKGCLQMQLVVWLSSYNSFHCWKLEKQLLSNEFLIFYAYFLFYFTFLSCGCFETSFIWFSATRFWALDEFSMLFFIYKFCQLKCWYFNQLVVWIPHYYKLHQQFVARKLPLVTLLTLRFCLILKNHSQFLHFLANHNI